MSPQKAVSRDTDRARPHGPRVAALWATLLLATFTAISPSRAADCSVPGAHPTIQAAIDDTNCSRILLADASYAEPIEIARSLEILGTHTGTSRIEGPVAVTNGAVADLDQVLITGCSGARLTVGTGARVQGEGLSVVTPVSPPCFPLFYDGFESGGTNEWSSTSP